MHISIISQIKAWYQEDKHPHGIKRRTEKVLHITYVGMYIMSLKFFTMMTTLKLAYVPFALFEWQHLSQSAEA